MNRRRLVFLFIALSVLWSGLLVRAGLLKFWPDQRLLSLKKKQFETSVVLQSRRGDVLDRNGKELAVSMAAHSLFADPKLIQDPHRTAKWLSTIIDQPYKQVLQKLKSKNRRFVWLHRRMGRQQREMIEKKEIRGLGFIEESKRIYPNESLLSQVLGFVGSEGRGLDGLESRYESYLESDSKTVSMQRDARGRPLIVGGQLFTEAPDGADIELTIDREIQFVLEQELRAVTHEQNADGAVGVVLDAQTSEILALGNYPTFDPNRPGDFQPGLRRNRTITDAFEPGSVMKTFVLAGALSRSMVEPNTKVDGENGFFRIGDRIIREADEKHRFKMITVSDVLAFSSNVGTTKIALQLKSEGLRETLERFGFGEKTGVDLPGEARGILHPLPWRDHLLANISFGHGISASALQVANAYAAIANGGWLKQPYIVRQVRDRESGILFENKAKTLKRVLTNENVAKMRLMLIGATSAEATGVNARVSGFPVAGKTGTAQKVNPTGRGYLKDAYISSFAGFLPANDPRFVIYVAVDNPKKSYYGSAVAAPIFSRVASFAVRRSALAPVLISEANIVPQSDELPPSEAAPSLVLLSETESARPEVQAVTHQWAKALGFPGTDAAISASGNPGVLNATESANAKPLQGDSFGNKMNVGDAGAIVALEGNSNENDGSSTAPPISQENSLDPVKQEASRLSAQAVALSKLLEKPAPLATRPRRELKTIPSLKGLSLREALQQVSGHGIDIAVRGRGLVTRTVPEAGSALTDPRRLTIYLEPGRTTRSR